MDLVGPLATAQGNCKFAVVAIDYFTKWIEALVWLWGNDTWGNKKWKIKSAKEIEASSDNEKIDTDMIELDILQAVENLDKYQQETRKWRDRKVVKKEIKVGDLVIKKRKNWKNLGKLQET